MTSNNNKRGAPEDADEGRENGSPKRARLTINIGTDVAEAIGPVLAALEVWTKQTGKLHRSLGRLEVNLSLVKAYLEVVAQGGGEFSHEALKEQDVESGAELEQDEHGQQGVNGKGKEGGKAMKGEEKQGVPVDAADRNEGTMEAQQEAKCEKMQGVSPASSETI